LLKVKGLMDFLCDEDQLRHWVWDEWRGIYDESYLDQNVMGPIHDNAAGIEELRAKLGRMVHGGAAPRTAGDGTRSELTWATGNSAGTDRTGATGGTGSYSHTGGDPATSIFRTTTVPEPFKLTAPKPRRIPMPEKIEAGFEARPVPKTNRAPDGTAAKIAAAKEAARERVRQLHAAAKAPALTERRVQQQPEEGVGEDAAAVAAAGGSYKARPVPQYAPGHAPVRLNTAALLKEHHLIAQRDAAAKDAIMAFENNLRDDTANAAEAERRKIREEQARLEAVEERRSAARESAQRAAQSKERALRAKRAEVKRMRESAAQAKAEAEAEERAAQQKLHESAVQAHETEVGTVGGGGAAQATLSKAEKLARGKRRSARALSAQSRTLVEASRAERETELAEAKLAARVARAKREAAAAAVGTTAATSGVTAKTSRPDPAVPLGPVLLSSTPALAVPHLRAQAKLAQDQEGV
jgi:hypothetical protein